jgi:hypothetical protein
MAAAPGAGWGSSNLLGLHGPGHSLDIATCTGGPTLLFPGAPGCLPAPKLPGSLSTHIDFRAATVRIEPGKCPI